MKLKTEGNDHTEDPIECANILNEFFSSQFCKQHQLDSNNSHNCTASSIEVSDAGVAKLLTALKNGKSAGTDDIRKEDLVIDPTSIFTVSLSTSTLPGEW